MLLMLLWMQSPRPLDPPVTPDYCSNGCTPAPTHAAGMVTALIEHGAQSKRFLTGKISGEFLASGEKIAIFFSIAID